MYMMEGLHQEVPQEVKNFSAPAEGAGEAKKYTPEMMQTKGEFIEALSELESVAEQISQEAVKVDEAIRNILDKQPTMDNITEKMLAPLEAKRAELGEKLTRVKDAMLEVEKDVMDLSKQIVEAGGPQVS